MIESFRQEVRDASWIAHAPRIISLDLKQSLEDVKRMVD